MEIRDSEIFQLVSSIKQTIGYDFSQYSEKSLKRRIEKVVSDNNKDTALLCSMIRQNKTFAERIVNDITVNTTELFRDVKIWQYLKHKVLPKLAQKDSLRIWHAGCSTGQEVYSMMILLNELDLLSKADILATDINTEAIKKAQSGTYKYRFNIGYLDNFEAVIRKNPYNYEEFNNVPFDKYFSIDKDNDTLQMNSFLQEKPEFRRHNLVTDNNIYYKFDLILCRNVIIYFNQDLQTRIFQTFHERLNDNGYFALGAHESILGPMTSKFKKKGQVYLKL